MEGFISKELAEELMAIKGEVRGIILKTDTRFIIQEKGEEGLKKVEEEMINLGCPLKYKKVKTVSFYPIGLRAISLLVMKKVLGFSDDKIEILGFEVPKSSFLVRLYARFFAMDKRVFFRNAAKLWKQVVTIGEFKTALDDKNKMAISTLNNFNIHPILCTYLLGIIASFHKIATGAKKVSIKEIKCSFKEDDIHEFLATHEY